MHMYVVEIGPNLLAAGIVAALTVLVVQWWGFRSGRRA